MSTAAVVIICLQCVVLGYAIRDAIVRGAGR